MRGFGFLVQGKVGGLGFWVRGGSDVPAFCVKGEKGVFEVFSARNLSWFLDRWVYCAGCTGFIIRISVPFFEGAGPHLI